MLSENAQLKTAFLQGIVKRFSGRTPPFQTPSNFIRNVCIVAHVDHGKTTLADYLISTNGIISARLAGKLRYMDSRDDEQERGITMKSSAISLFYDPVFINLIDSPGHVDFCAEVNSAINLTDVAILVVDVVEGVCSQTKSLLREVVVRQLDVVLVLNKLDRLATELQMNGAEAFRHLQHLVEHVNSCLSQALQTQFLDEDNWQRLEEAENRLYFDPLKGNLIFASAYHGYAFSVGDFAALWAKKLDIPKAELQPYMFSLDHYFQPSSKKVLPGAESKGRRSLFEQLVLEPLWELHKCAFIDEDVERLTQLATKLGLRECRRRCRAEEAFGEYMREWLPLTSAVIRTICAVGRSPAKMFGDGDASGSVPSGATDRLVRVCGGAANPLRLHLRACDPVDAVAVVHVAKFFLLDGRKVALCRVMCGTVRENTEFVVMSACSRQPTDSVIVKRVRLDGLFIVLGKDLISVSAAPAGQICALQAADDQWIGGHALVTAEFFKAEMDLDDGGAALQQRLAECRLRFGADMQAEPLVRVTIQPASGADMSELKAALKQLAILDTAVRLFEQENGDLALVTAGEVHLQKCLTDLNNLGQTNLIVSEPIVPFLETIVPDLNASHAKIASEHETECLLRQFNQRFRLRATPLPDEIVELLQRHHDCIDRLREGSSDESFSKFRDELLQLARTILPKLKGSWWLKKSNADVERLFRRIWTFGPHNARSNLLINALPDHEGPFVWPDTCASKRRSLDRAIIGGFQLAVSQGNLCEEPMQGVCVILEEWGVIQDDADPTDASNDSAIFDAQLHGQMISAMRQTCRAAFKKHPQRLVAAMYKCLVQTSTQALGKVQSVLAQRRAKVVSEDVNEMSGLFEVVAHMPVVESFSFCDQLRKKTSGLASAQLAFSHWQLIDEDPFWEPTTVDEMEEFGTNKNSVASQARIYMNAVRKRKGIPTDEIIVVNAEKQRNLKRNK